MMESVVKKFEHMGARVVTGSPREGATFVIDVDKDRRGEFFDLRATEEAEVEVLDVNPRERHLLLLAKDSGEKFRFLCGHDERSWFVATLPANSNATNVGQAKAALMPGDLPDRLKSVKKKKRNRRHNAAFVRQGEWFFVPALDLEANPLATLKNEPIQRDREGSPHVAEEAYRLGGTMVFILQRYDERAEPLPTSVQALAFRQGLNVVEYEQMLRENPFLDPAKSRSRWTTRVRDPILYVRGAIRHPDHATIVLKGWHRVLMNLEPQVVRNAGRPVRVSSTFFD